ncbi:DUF4350 domain-containing protein [Arthrobacter cavernae]|uniref:DUF4350 domain-containing protein n=1 Tax=Arthrobacter cavernae TaxID=2817681 RepID=A0A939HED6_9MICC|nr:DUF4350 domain-containing protein [Arthrobacter cavernae]MBO1266823.1 DUF4350 domain-containing protein [Arthrobacter cavernae]
METPVAPAAFEQHSGGTSTAAPVASASALFTAWARRHVVWIVIGALFAGMLVYVTVSKLQAPAETAVLSTRNPAPEGGMALAEILRRHGVTVTATDSLEATHAALAGSDHATLLLYDAHGFLEEEQLVGLAGAAGRVVLVAPRLRTLGALTQDIRPGGVVPEGTGTLEPGCGRADAQAAGPVSAGGFTYQGPELCYRTRPEGPGMVAGSRDGQLLVVGSTALLGNGLLDEEGNAALALRSLGTGQDLVWYTPGLGDIPAGNDAPTLDELAPPWLAFLGPWLSVVALLSMLWRGRRLGPLVFEPLPVVVKAAETAEGRARLYQDSRAVERAADNLRAGAMTRIARHFNLGAEADADAVVDAVSRRLGRPPQEIRTVLVDHRPQSEGQLVQWAQQIERLEEEATAR